MTGALILAAQGLAVLPIYPLRNGSCTCSKGAECVSAGKHPIWSGWTTKATSNVAVLTKEWPAASAGIGIHLGKSGFVVIDVDPRNGGTDSLAQLERCLGVCFAHISQVIVATGGGGWHFYFTAPAPGMCDGLVDLKRVLVADYPGIDLLWGDHCTVAPPSIHRLGKTYAFEKDDWDFLTNPPSELLELRALERQGIAQKRDAGSREAVPPSSVLDNVERATPETEANLERVKSALGCISAGCDYSGWRDMLFALHATGWATAEGVARRWSEQSGKFDPVSFNSVWQSAKADRPKSVTIATLFYRAAEAGWIDPAKQSGVPLETFGDLSNGQRWANQYRGSFLYCMATSSWYCWDGMRWAPEADAQALQAAKVIAEQITDASLAALRADPTDWNKRGHSEALSVHRNARRWASMLGAASTEPGMFVKSQAAFDSAPFLLGVTNGVVDLQAGELLAAHQDQLISKQAGTHFDPAAKCPRWMEFLSDVFEGNQALITFMQRVVGYCLTGSVSEEKLFFLFGHGRNGKSVFCTVIETLLGECAVTISPTILTKNGGAEGARYVSRLAGARMASANELGTADIWDDERIKSLISRDKIAARKLYGEAYDFNPTHKMIVRGNHQPGVHDAGDGMWRRLVLIPFNRQFTDAEVIPNLDEQLISDELPGILAWSMAGCLDWQRGGLRIPSCIQSTTAAYRRETDLLGLWLEECTKQDRTAETDGALLYASFGVWCGEQGVRAESRIAFGRQLKSRGIALRASNGKRLCKGLVLFEG